MDDVVGKLADADGHVRRAALHVLAELSPELAATHAENMLGDPHKDVVTMALEILRARHTIEEVAAMAAMPEVQEFLEAWRRADRGDRD